VKQRRRPTCLQPNQRRAPIRQGITAGRASEEGKIDRMTSK
jgi:hypothetical protein